MEEVFVYSQSLKFSVQQFPPRSQVRHLLGRFLQSQGLSSSEDFYVVRNGRLSHLEDPLQPGGVYRLEPRLCGGKGGFGSMLRALGAQIEKTTNREACRDLSGRRLRDVNHEKEMAEWLKKQAEREAEKEQRRLERLQRKLAEPKHHFTDPEYQQQCHDLSERLEDSVIKGLQASSSGQVKAHDVPGVKRPSLNQSEQPQKKKMKTVKKATAAAACFWMGVDELPSSEDDEDDEDNESPPSSSSCGANVTMRTHMEDEPEQSSSSSECSSSSADQSPGPSETPVASETAGPSKTSGASQAPGPSETSGASETPGPSESPKEEETLKPPEDQGPSEEPSCRSQQETIAVSQTDLSQVDLSSVSSVSELEALGLDVLKEALMSRGLKCGGTLTERATRLLSVRGLTPDQIDPALLAKPSKTKRK